MWRPAQGPAFTASLSDRRHWSWTYGVGQAPNLPRRLYPEQMFIDMRSRQRGSGWLWAVKLLIICITDRHGLTRCFLDSRGFFLDGRGGFLDGRGRSLSFGRIGFCQGSLHVPVRLPNETLQAAHCSGVRSCRAIAGKIRNGCCDVGA